MARKKRSNMLKIDELLGKSGKPAWCTVDTENEFSFDGMRFKIDGTVEQYKVLEKGVHNLAQMDMVLCVDDGEELKFFDQNLVEINEELVKIV